MEEFMKAAQEGFDSGLVKVRFDLDGKVSSEHVWAKPLGKNYARLLNIPFFVEDSSIDDVVQVSRDGDDPMTRFVRTVSRSTRKHLIAYKPAKTEKLSSNRFAKIVKHFHSHGCKVEGQSLGRCWVATPIAMDEWQAIEVITASPYFSEFC